MDRPRPTRDRGRAPLADAIPRRATHSTARNAGSRTGSCGWARSSRSQIRGGVRALVDHDAGPRSAVIEGDRAVNEAQRAGDATSSR